MSYNDWYKVGGYALGAMPKCATRSILLSLERTIDPGVAYADLSPSECRGRWVVDVTSPSVAVIRHPVDRFCSLWRCQVRDELPGIAPKGERRGITPEQLLALAKSQKPSVPINGYTDFESMIWREEIVNWHLEKQSLLVPLADYSIKFESLPAWWSEHVSFPLEHMNATGGDTSFLTDSLRMDVENFYHEDLAAYKAAA